VKLETGHTHRAATFAHHVGGTVTEPSGRNLKAPRFGPLVFAASTWDAPWTTRFQTTRLHQLRPVRGSGDQHAERMALIRASALLSRRVHGFYVKPSFDIDTIYTPCRLQRVGCLCAGSSMSQPPTKVTFAATPCRTGKNLAAGRWDRAATDIQAGATVFSQYVEPQLEPSKGAGRPAPFTTLSSLHKHFGRCRRNRHFWVAQIPDLIWRP